MSDEQVGSFVGSFVGRREFDEGNKVYSFGKSINNGEDGGVVIGRG